MRERTTDTLHPLHIAITGLKAGTGSSTLSKQMAKQFEIPRVYAGAVRRALAHVWDNYAYQTRDLGHAAHPQDIWNDFASLFNQSPTLAETLIKPYYNLDEDEVILNRFNNDHKRFGSEVDPFETIPDVFMFRALNDSCILDGKLAVAIDRLQPANQKSELVQLFNSFPGFEIPLIRILLDVDQQEAARRIYLRENGHWPAQSDQAEVEKISDEIEDRIAYDRVRYPKSYDNRLTKQPIDLDDFTNLPHTKLIDTTSLAPQEVLSKSLNHVMEVLGTIKHDHPHSYIHWLQKALKTTESR